MRTITSVLSHGKQAVSPTHGLFNSSRPFLSTRSYLNGHTISSATMISIRRSTTRPGLTPLRQSNLLQSLLLNRSCQSYARPGRMFPTHPRASRNPPSRQPLWPYRRYYNQNSHDSYFKAIFRVDAAKGFVEITILISCAVYLHKRLREILADGGDQAENDLHQRHTVNSLENVREGRWWVLFTSSFAHANLLHLGINMACLWSFGPAFVSAFGMPCFAGVWAVSAVACSAASLGWESTSNRLRMETAGRGWYKAQEYKILGIPISRRMAVAIAGGHQHEGSVGASGALCGLIGVLLCVAPTASVHILGVVPAPLWASELVFVGGSAYCMLTGNLPAFGHAGHLGGTAAGIAYYYVRMRPWLRRTGRL